MTSALEHHRLETPVPRTDYSQVFQNTTAVENYDGVQYAADSQSSAVNRRQRRYPRRLVSDSFPAVRNRPSTTSPAAPAVPSSCCAAWSRTPTDTTCRRR